VEVEVEVEAKNAMMPNAAAMHLSAQSRLNTFFPFSPSVSAMSLLCFIFDSSNW
jgi:hypothetical protein